VLLLLLLLLQRLVVVVVLLLVLLRRLLAHRTGQMVPIALIYGLVSFDVGPSGPACSCFQGARGPEQIIARCLSDRRAILLVCLSELGRNGRNRVGELGNGMTVFLKRSWVVFARHHRGEALGIRNLIWCSTKTCTHTQIPERLDTYLSPRKNAHARGVNVVTCDVCGLHTRRSACTYHLAQQGKTLELAGDDVHDDVVSLV
jgi:hypothetical protein